MAVTYVDLNRNNRPLEDDFIEALQKAIKSGDFVLGNALQSFEQNFSKALKVRHAIGVGSGSDALALTLLAVGVAPGDEVICSTFAPISVPEAIVRAGGTVVFVDVEEDLTMDAEGVRAALTERTKAIIATHLFGLMARMDVLTQISSDYGLYLIEDCTHACGARWGENAVGAMGIAGCFSFYPTRNLGALGDGGMVVTENEQLAERIRLFRNHGRDENGRSVLPGFNSRLDSLQAAFLDIKLPNLSEDNADRVANASFYENHLSKEIFELPPYRDDDSHVYNHYTIRHPQRDALKSFLGERHIETQIYYPLPLHLQPCFDFLGYREGHFPQAEQYARQVMSLPIAPGLSRKDLDEVVHTLDLYVKTHPVEAAP